uniref:Uncharacterized protein n=1 Tax=uncultured marine virus TaxID=186617 RepID=A0A0F7LAV2_9VIRU|nr:hypothetical protein CENSYa_0508 [uncultured marine virus]
MPQTTRHANTRFRRRGTSRPVPTLPNQWMFLVKSRGLPVCGSVRMARSAT